jgi:hypothetical protein
VSQKRSEQNPSTVRTYEYIVSDRDDPSIKRAREAIELLTGQYRIPAFEIHWRIDAFGAYEHFGTGRRWSERFTITRTRAKGLARRLRNDAEDLRQALAPQFRTLIGLSGPMSADAICDLVGRAAVLIEGSLTETTDRAPDWTLEPKRQLTRFVMGAAGKPLDRELSELISAILGLERYTAEEQRKFRERSCELNPVPPPHASTPSRRQNRTRSS